MQPPAETLEEFYQHKLKWLPETIGQQIGHFNVFRLEDCWQNGQSTVQYPRRSYYKVTLIRGRHRYHYGDKSIEVSGATLLFFNPAIPYHFEPLSDDATGFFCIFTDAFISERMKGHLGALPMFAPGGKPAYALGRKEEGEAVTVFRKMLAEIDSAYSLKYDLLRNYTFELIHLALKLEPEEMLYQHPNADARITSVFTELLERQFPIETPAQRFTLRSAKDFAGRLSVHVNHLNRAVKATTGKTTTQHIAERLAAEAAALLKHTDWNVSEIAYSLGFEEPAHFSHFFKKHTATTPSAFRAV